MVTGLVPKEDERFTINRLLELFELEELDEDAVAAYQSRTPMSREEAEESLEELLNRLLDYAYEKGILKENSVVYRDLFDTKIMGMLMPRPGAVSYTHLEIIGIVPKTHIPNYNEFYEARYFSPGKEEAEGVDIAPAYHVPMGSHILFQCDDVLPELVIGVEICEDVWTPNPPSISHALAGATLIVNLSASDETTGKDIYRRELVAGQSARLLCGYIYASAGDGESTQDVVYSGHNIIAENGAVLAAVSYTHLDVYKRQMQY